MINYRIRWVPGRAWKSSNDSFRVFRNGLNYESIVKMLHDFRLNLWATMWEDRGLLYSPRNAIPISITLPAHVRLLATYC